MFLTNFKTFARRQIIFKRICSKHWSLYEMWQDLDSSFGYFSVYFGLGIVFWAVLGTIGKNASFERA
jgi:hypothetical protein